MTDSGSPIGKFWYKIFNGDKFLTLFFTRLTVSICYCLVLLPLVSIGSWLGYFIGCIVLIGNTLLWAVYIKDEGMIGIYLVEELMIGAGVGIAACLSIL